LYTLEKSKPYLFVQDFSVYRNPLIAMQKTGVAPLEVQFTLAGYVHAKAPAAGSADAATTGDDAQ
jgi:general secretion pathway protein M